MTSGTARRHVQERGFTLVELLVVMLVVGILAALAVPHFTQQREAGYRGAVKSDLRNAVLTVESRFSEDPNGFTDLDNPYFHSPSGIHWRGTAGVDVSVSNNPASTTTTYCLRASHAALSEETWRYKRGVDSAPRQLACAAAP
jgi:prepilin-type N-terminal cleavage/methylation domain-containing protein